MFVHWQVWAPYQWLLKRRIYLSINSQSLQPPTSRARPHPPTSNDSSSSLCLASKHSRIELYVPCGKRREGERERERERERRGMQVYQCLNLASRLLSRFGPWFFVSWVTFPSPRPQLPHQRWRNRVALPRDLKEPLERSLAPQANWVTWQQRYIGDTDKNYSGISLLRTVPGPHEVLSWLKRCPYFRGCFVHFSM